MSEADRLRRFTDLIGYSFRNQHLLAGALSHPSIGSDEARNFQRLEFLGDRIVGLVIAETVYGSDRSASPGQLAERLNSLVCGETCTRIARSIGIESVLRFNGSIRRPDGEVPPSVLEDALEALVAAVYRDGGFDAARALVLRLWEAHAGIGIGSTVANTKSQLQEWALARGLSLPRYEEVSRSGPAHAPDFVVRVTLADGRSASARGPTIRSAERSAAAAVLASVERDSVG